MKKVFNALIMVSVMLTALSFTGCKNDAEEITTVAVFTCTDEEGTSTLYCYSNNEYKTHIKKTDEDGVKLDLDIAAGTYTGSPENDGTCTFKTTKGVDPFSLNFLTSFLGGSEATLTNANFPLEDIPADQQVTNTVTITNGQFTLEGAVYIRQ